LKLDPTKAQGEKDLPQHLGVVRDASGAATLQARRTAALPVRGLGQRDHGGEVHHRDHGTTASMSAVATASGAVSITGALTGDGTHANIA
jgi:hypothetical protein